MPEITLYGFPGHGMTAVRQLCEAGGLVVQVQHCGKREDTATRRFAKAAKAATEGIDGPKPVLVFGPPEWSEDSGRYIISGLDAWADANRRLMDIALRHRNGCLVVNALMAVHDPEQLLAHLAPNATLESVPRAVIDVVSRLKAALISADTRSDRSFRQAYIDLSSISTVEHDPQELQAAETSWAMAALNSLSETCEANQARALSLEEELNGCRQRISVMEANLIRQSEAARTSNEAANARVAEAGKEMASLVTELELRGAEVMEARARADSLERELLAARTGIESHLRSLIEAQEYIEAQRKELNEIHSSNESQRIELAHARNSYESERTELIKARATIEAQRRELVEVTAKNDSERTELTEARARIASLLELESDRSFKHLGVQTVEDSTELRETREQVDLLVLHLHHLQKELEAQFLRAEELADGTGGKRRGGESMARIWRANQPEEFAIDMRWEIDGSGWHAAEADGRWTGPDNLSVVRFPALKSGLYLLKFTIVGLMYPAQVSELSARVNDMDVGLVVEPGGGHWVAVGAVEVTDEGANDWTVELQLPRTMAPAPVGMGDSRLLGVRVSRIALIFRAAL